MVKSKNIIAGLGVVAGLGMALLPLGAFAANEQTSDNYVIRATVAEQFTLKVTPTKTMTAGKSVTDALEIEKGKKNETLKHHVEVEGNLYLGYDLTVAAVETTDLRFVKNVDADFWTDARYDDNVKIPTGTNIADGNSAWGFKYSETEDSFTGNYNALTLAGVNIKNQPNTSRTAFHDHVYLQYGISVADSQAAGTYEGQVVYKATPKTSS